MTVILSDEHGKITGNKATLNYLSIVLNEASARYESYGAYALARQASVDADLIYEALDACHYYDDVR